jgi:hypothetical protein
MTWLFAKTQEGRHEGVEPMAEVANARGIPRVQAALCLAPGKAGHYRRGCDSPIVTPVTTAL